MKSASTILISVVLAVGALFGVQHFEAPKSAASFGASGPFNPTGGSTYRLQSSIGLSDTSITLSSFKEPTSNIPYTMSYLNSSIEYATLDPQSSTKEFVSFSGITQNADGSATLTGVVRGLGFSYPYTASSTLIQPHSAQSIFILSNPPQLYNQYGALLNTNVWSGVNTFSSTSPPRYDEPGAQAAGSFIATTSEFASVAYVNAIALSGSPNANTTTKGIVQLATGLQAASSTSLGSTGAFLVLPSSLATDTPNANTNKSDVLMSDLTGHLKQTWLDLTSAFSVSGTWAFTNTVSIAASNAFKFTLNTVAYVFPTSQGTAGTVLKDDGSGNLSWGNPARFVYATTTAVTFNSNNSTNFATSTLFSFPSGSITASSTITVVTNGSCQGSGNTESCSITLADQAGRTIGSGGVASAGSSSVRNWNSTITLVNNMPTGSVSYISNANDSSPAANNAAASIANTNLATDTGFFVVLTGSNPGTGAATLNAATIVLNP